jgi:hypothetical protein
LCLLWPRQTSASTRVVLHSMAVLIDAYRQQLPLAVRSFVFPSRVCLAD